MTKKTDSKSLSAMLISGILFSTSLAFAATVGADSMTKEGMMEKNAMKSDRMMDKDKAMMTDNKEMMDDGKAMMKEDKAMMKDDKGMMKQ